PSTGALLEGSPARGRAIHTPGEAPGTRRSRPALQSRAAARRRCPPRRRADRAAPPRWRGAVRRVLPRRCARRGSLARLAPLPARARRHPGVARGGDPAVGRDAPLRGTFARGAAAARRVGGANRQHGGAAAFWRVLLERAGPTLEL